MSEEQIPQRIAIYRARYAKNSSAYVRRARFFLLVPEVVVGGLVSLHLVLWLGVTVAIALLFNHPLLVLLLLVATMSLPVVRAGSFRRAISTAPNVYLTQKQKPSTGLGLVVGFLLFLVLLGILEVWRESFAVHVILTLLSSVFLFYVFRYYSLIREMWQYYTRVPVAEGETIPDGPARTLREEYAVCAAQAPGVPPVEGVFITNVADVQFGPVIVGERRYKNGLAVGLPLLQSVTPEQFRANLLSECFSWSVPAGALFHRCIDRYVAWNRLVFELSGAFHWGATLYAPFNTVIYTRLTAHLFLLSRLVRREADIAVASHGMLAPLQDGLANQSYKHRIFEKAIWSDMYRMADDTGATSLEPFAAIQGELAGEHDLEQAKLVLNESMVSWGDGVPLVPTPSERLTMMQATPFVPEQQDESAADYYFGDQLQGVIGAVDTSWSLNFFDMYGDLLTRRREAREELEGLLQLAETYGADKQKEKSFLLWRAGKIRAGLAEGDSDLDAALDLYVAAVAANPAFSLARLSAARLFLDRDNDQGLALLDPILNDVENADVNSGIDNPDDLFQAYTMVREYFRENEMEEEAKELEDRHLNAYKQSEQDLRVLRKRAEEERRRVGALDTLLPHGLDAPGLQHVLRVLERYDRVSSAVLVRKAVRYFPDYPFYLLGLEITRPSLRGILDPGGHVLYAQRVVEELQFMRGGVGVVLLYGVDQLVERLRSTPDTLIYRRANSGT